MYLELIIEVINFGFDRVLVVMKLFGLIIAVLIEVIVEEFS